MKISQKHPVNFSYFLLNVNVMPVSQGGILNRQTQYESIIESSFEYERKKNS